MTAEEKAGFDELDLIELMKRADFKRFLGRILAASGLLRSQDGLAPERLLAAEGRRAFGAEILGWIEEVEDRQHLSGLPVFASIHLLSVMSHEASAKEAHRRGRRGSGRNDRDDGDDGG